MACGDRKPLPLGVLDRKSPCRNRPRSRPSPHRRRVARPGVLLTTRRNPLSQMYARERGGGWTATSSRCCAGPATSTARGAMQLGAYFAGVSIENSMLGVCPRPGQPADGPLRPAPHCDWRAPAARRPVQRGGGRRSVRRLAHEIDCSTATARRPARCWPCASRPAARRRIADAAVGSARSVGISRCWPRRRRSSGPAAQPRAGDRATCGNSMERPVIHTSLAATRRGALGSSAPLGSRLNGYKKGTPHVTLTPRLSPRPSSAARPWRPVSVAADPARTRKTPGPSSAATPPKPAPSRLTPCPTSSSSCGNSPRRTPSTAPRPWPTRRLLRPEDEHLYAVDLATGTKKWIQGRPDQGVAGPTATGRLRRRFQRNFHCVDAKTGQKRWTFTPGRRSRRANFAGDKIFSDLTMRHCTAWTRTAPRSGNSNGGPVKRLADGAGDRRSWLAATAPARLGPDEEGRGAGVGDPTAQAAATAAVVGDKLYRSARWQRGA